MPSPSEAALRLEPTARLSPAAQVAEELRRGSSFLVAAHYHPDGDALGSTAAVGWLLRRLGKPFVLYNESPRPRQFDWLALPGELTNDLPAQMPETLIILDCGDAARMGAALEGWYVPERTVLIDHHLGNPRFGRLNWVDEGYAAVGEMIGEVADELDIPLAGELGQAVYLALTTDTGHFSYGNTSPRCMEMAARIIRLGLEPGPFNARLTNTMTRQRLALWSRTLADMRFHFDGRLAVVRASLADLAATGAGQEDVDGLVNMARSVRGVEAAVCLRQDDAERVKFSLRSTGDVDVRAVAVSFGGGGHKNAAGCSVPAGLDEAERLLVEAAGRLLFAGGRP